MEAEQPESTQSSASGLSMFFHHWTGSSCVVSCTDEAVGFAFAACAATLILRDVCRDLRDLCVPAVPLLVVDAAGDRDLLGDLLADLLLRLVLRCRVLRAVFFGFFVPVLRPSFLSSRSARAAFISAIFLGSSAPPPLSKQFAFVCPIRPQFSHLGSVRVCCTTAASPVTVCPSDVEGVATTLAVGGVEAAP